MELFHRQSFNQKNKKKRGKGKGKRGGGDHLSQPYVPATTNRVSIADIIVEVLQIIGRIIPVDRHEIDLTIVAQGKELREPAHAIWAVGDGWCTEGSAFSVWHHVGAKGISGILRGHA